MNDRIQDIMRLRVDVEMLGTERLVKYAIARGDPATLCGLIEVLQLTSSEAVDLIVAFATRRYCRADAAAFDAWIRRDSAFLLRHIGETSEVEPSLAN